MLNWLRIITVGFFTLLASGCAFTQKTAVGAAGNPNSFVVIGDCIADDLAQLRQSVKDIAALNPKPSYIFFCGDLVEGGKDDEGKTLRLELDQWMEEYHKMAKAAGLKVPLVLIPGNHELLRIVNRNGKLMEIPEPNADPIWLESLKKNGFAQFGGNGPTGKAPNSDLLLRDNSRLTYSFDDNAGNHFIVIDTDTLSNAENPPKGWIPYHWIADDLKRAETDPKIRHIFAFGHKPIRIAQFPFDPKGDNSILGSSDHSLAQKLLADFGNSAKFGGYFCGHVHLWDCSLIPDSKKVWQVIAGNGGSKPIKQESGPWKPPYYFGFSEVRIHPDGGVGAVSYNRPIPEPYDSPSPQPPAKPQSEVMLFR
jgi:hypothetical protein